MDKFEIATFASGCFWCTEAVFRQLRGVHKVLAGYAGGTVANPTYDEVCSGRTKHAESVQISFDPQVIGYADLIEIFWHSHDPTTLNRQGPDRGSQYRSIIFYHDENQKRVAEESRQKAETDRLWPDPIVTEIVPFTGFYPAEDYHQEYYHNNRNQPYCVMLIDPKVQKLKKQFSHLLKVSADIQG